MRVLSVDAAAADHPLRRRRVLSPKFLGRSGKAGGAAAGAYARGQVTWALGISSILYFFLYSLRILFFEASICTMILSLYNSMRSIEHRCALMSFLSTYVKNPFEMSWTDSTKDMMASFFFYYVEVPRINDK